MWQVILFFVGAFFACIFTPLAWLAYRRLAGSLNDKEAGNLFCSSTAFAVAAWLIVFKTWGAL